MPRRVPLSAIVDDPEAPPQAPAIEPAAATQSQSRSGPWSAAQPAPDFLVGEEDEPDWLIESVLAYGAVTEFFSPRGIGKSHVAHALAVTLAKAGRRILMIDRDNPRREVRRRLRAWGAVDTPGLKIITREKAPPLTNVAAWAAFPYQDYDLVVIDSLDAATKGVGEKDSAKPSKALAPILDIAHRTNGPAFLILGNTVKTGKHGRGSGIVEDRADLCFEVRDATGLKPSGFRDWWLDLPQSGAKMWADRAGRRKRRDTYRLAFVPSKFRIGEEPEPFVWELHLPEDGLWSLEDVTADVVAVGDTARVEAERAYRAALDRAARGLAEEVGRRAASGRPLVSGDAESFLLGRFGLKRAEARRLIAERDGQAWQLEEQPGRAGKPRVLLPPVEPAS